ncbi:hypothetical protein D3C87_1658800 [compost metagenome]
MAHALRQAGQLHLLARHQTRWAAQASCGLVQPLVACIQLALHPVADAASHQS